MLKTRLIPILFLSRGFLVRSESFSIHQNLGNPIAQVNRYSQWNVDELIYIDITPSHVRDNNKEYNDHSIPIGYETIITNVSKNCFMPLTFGGRIRTIEDARLRFELGADKITINSQCIKDPSFINQLALTFGSQAIVVSIDAKRISANGYRVFTDWGKKDTGLSPIQWAREVSERGAGEILINSIDNDGKASGYDLQLIKDVVQSTNIPIIACGGVGKYQHFVDAISETGVSAVAAGNIFHFKELAYPLAKRFLKMKGYDFR